MSHCYQQSVFLQSHYGHDSIGVIPITQGEILFNVLKIVNTCKRIYTHV